MYKLPRGFTANNDQEIQRDNAREKNGGRVDLNLPKFSCLPPAKEVVMNKRLTDREKLSHKLQQLSDLEVGDVLAYLSLMEGSKFRHSERISVKDQKVSLNGPNSDDELLSLLSSAYENRRACQVFEWEAARRKSEIKAGRYAR